MKVLVTGGAGYIGSHAVKMLLAKGHQVLVVDNLSTGFRSSVPTSAELLEYDVGDIDGYRSEALSFAPDAVMHFAAAVKVEESVSDPWKYYENNFLQSACLINFCADEVRPKRFIFSSTAAVYGEPKNVGPISENEVKQPINPYGWSKLCTENLLKDYAKLGKIRPIIFRYFNVAGGAADGSLGQKTAGATHLIKVASEVAIGLRKKIYVYGNDYCTKDGTAERDYIHVDDLVEAHVLALDDSISVSPYEVFNLGYGSSYSVLQVIKTMDQVSANGVGFEVSDRRAGDPEQLSANSSKARRALGWNPRYDNLQFICQSAYDWEKTMNSLASHLKKIHLD